MNQIQLRQLRLADIPRIAELEQELFGADAWSAQILAMELDAAGRDYIVAVQGQTIVGYAGVWLNGDVAEVMTIGVAYNQQNQGIGTILVRQLVDAAKSAGVQELWLEVREDNNPAIALYRRADFEQVGIRRRYYRTENKDALTMRLKIGQNGVS